MSWLTNKVARKVETLNFNYKTVIPEMNFPLLYFLHQQFNWWNKKSSKNELKILKIQRKKQNFEKNNIIYKHIGYENINHDLLLIEYGKFKPDYG